MIRQICNVRPQDIVTTRSNELLVWLGIEDLDLILKERRLLWYGHVECSNGAVKTAFDIQDGKYRPGRPKMTWKQLTERDCREWKLSAINPNDRHTWRSGVRSAMRAASQLSVRGPLVWMLPLYLHVNQKSDYDDDDDMRIDPFSNGDWCAKQANGKLQKLSPLIRNRTNDMFRMTCFLYKAGSFSRVTITLLLLTKESYCNSVFMYVETFSFTK